MACYRLSIRKICIVSLFGMLLYSCNSTSKLATSTSSPVFNHLAIYVMDLNSTRLFYTQILGLDTVPEPFKDGKHLWLSMGGKAKLHIIEGADKKVSYLQNNHYCFSVLSVADFVIKLNKNNLQYVNAKGEKNAITTRTDGVKQVYFQDPDGYWLEINDDRN